MNCINCEAPNPDKWFYCKTCGCQSSEPKYTTNLYMMSEAGKRSDVEFSTISMDSHVEKLSKERKIKDNKMWKERIKQAGVS
tara:strand:+ start:38 stop:283 length:246 start_codon:yes stop_codon:yes gene_type:complete